MNMHHSRWFKITALAVALGIFASGFWYLFYNQGPIADFDDKRDTQEILKIFERDRYWLLASEDYSPEFMLKYRAPSQEIKYLGRLNLKVWWEKNKFVGFTAYYMKTPDIGQLLFLAVNPEFRGKGYAEKLLRRGLAELQKLGAKTVNLVTRTDNKPGQGLYKRVGFYETSRDNGFIYYNYDL